jgi:hypothetical protein
MNLSSIVKLSSVFELAIHEIHWTVYSGIIILPFSTDWFRDKCDFWIYYFFWFNQANLKTWVNSNELFVSRQINDFIWTSALNLLMLIVIMRWVLNPEKLSWVDDQCTVKCSMGTDQRALLMMAELGEVRDDLIKGFFSHRFRRSADMTHTSECYLVWHIIMCLFAGIKRGSAHAFHEYTIFIIVPRWNKHCQSAICSNYSFCNAENIAIKSRWGIFLPSLWPELPRGLKFCTSATCSG